MTGSRRLRIGNIYDHPEQGPIRIESGAFLIDGRISNHWHWTILATGEESHGYGGEWDDISDQYVTVTVPINQIIKQTRTCVLVDSQQGDTSDASS